MKNENQTSFKLIECPTCHKLNMPQGNKFCSFKCAEEHVRDPNAILKSEQYAKEKEEKERLEVEEDKRKFKLNQTKKFAIEESI